MTDNQTGSPLIAAEADVLRLAANGGTNAEIAAALGISAHIVNERLRSIYGKLGVHDRTHAVALTLRLGIVALDSVDCGQYLAAVHQRAADAEARRDRLAAALDEALRSFTHQVHPGYAGLRSQVEPVATVEEWRAVLVDQTGAAR